MKARDFASVPLLDRLPRLGDLRAREVEWVVRGIIPAASLCLFAGRYASYKSWLLRDLAAATAAGNQWAGFEVPRPRPVLFIDRENAEAQIARLSAHLNPEEFSAPCQYWGSWVDLKSPDGRRITPSPKLEVLREWSRQNRGLIVFDSLIRFLQGATENDAGEMGALMMSFLDLAREGSAVAIIHHQGKNRDQKFRGSEAIADALDVGYTVERDDEETSLVRLTAFKNRLEVERTEDLVLVDGRFRRQWEPRHEGAE